MASAPPTTDPVDPPDPLGQTTTYVFDAHNRVIAIWDPPGLVAWNPNDAEDQEGDPHSEPAPDSGPPPNESPADEPHVRLLDPQ